MLHRLPRVLHALSGWFVLYLVIDVGAGFGTRSPYQPVLNCFLPFSIDVRWIQSACPDPAVNIFWFSVVRLPRLLIICPALAIAFLKAAVFGAFSGIAVGAVVGVLEAIQWLVYSIPAIVLVWAGTLYWWKQYRAVATIALALIMLEIIAMALIL
jgi:hypothetical protein